MTFIVILLVLVLALFVGAFLSRRRFGVLGLGLSAGAIISPIWGDNASFVVSALGLVAEGPLVNAIALSAIILIPAVLFMFHGYTYKHLLGRVVGSLLFTLLAAAFLAGPIAAALTLTGPVGIVYQWIVMNRELIVSVGVALAIADFLVSRTVHKSEKKKH
ncbi:MAG: hypothetical protein EOT05_00520 [Candidatus Microsaccharimonas sossegonensis]|uniref:Uncharacterized protein n=1 Tax=Candidatus Microsaccharimonas sossegonensis TaxID=2506948 RepID=A0A4V1J7C8_9BACT|nr:MAG: hypothetical protein EOT05_00520 [Candidatus Microsaccharimonas sossegonensis]